MCTRPAIGAQRDCCSQSRSIQDYKPRHFAFSFGFYCEHKLSNSFLKGLWCNITIYSQTNETKCPTMAVNVPFLFSILQLSVPPEFDRPHKQGRSYFALCFTRNGFLEMYSIVIRTFWRRACYLFFSKM